MTANDTVSRVVELELERRGMQRQQLAKALGHHPSWVSMKLNGDRRWGVDDLDAVAAVLGLPVAMLLMAPRELVTATQQYLARTISTTRAYHARRWGLLHNSSAA